MIVTAKIIKVEKHPDASKLKVCQVTDGQQSFQVVCGAVNCAEGMITILAKPGSITPNGVAIKEAELRGVKSQGMLCSSKDLGITQETGIVDLPPNTAIGLDFEKVSPELLSSIPWYQFKETESYYLDASTKRIHIIHNNEANKRKDDWKLISKTYFVDGEYRHRHFN